MLNDEMLVAIIAGVFALGGVALGFIGLLISNLLEQRRIIVSSVVQSRKELFILLVRTVARVPTKSKPIDVFEEYHRSLTSIFNDYTGELVLYGDPYKIADEFAKFYTLVNEAIKSDFCEKQHDAITTQGQKVIDCAKKYLGIRVILYNTDLEDSETTTNSEADLKHDEIANNNKMDSNVQN